MPPLAALEFVVALGYGIYLTNEDLVPTLKRPAIKAGSER